MSLKTGREDLKKNHIRKNSPAGCRMARRSFIRSFNDREIERSYINQQTIEQVQKQNWMNIQKKIIIRMNK